MIGLLLTIANITGGILLGLATLDKWDGGSFLPSHGSSWSDESEL